MYCCCPWLNRHHSVVAVAPAPQPNPAAATEPPPALTATPELPPTGAAAPAPQPDPATAAGAMIKLKSTQDMITAHHTPSRDTLAGGSDNKAMEPVEMMAGSPHQTGSPPKGSDHKESSEDSVHSYFVVRPLGPTADIEAAPAKLQKGAGLRVIPIGPPNRLKVYRPDDAPSIPAP